MFTTDIPFIESLLQGYEADVPTFLGDGNYAVTNGKDVALVEHLKGGVYACHYFFKSRGNEAVAVTKEMLDFFDEQVHPSVMMGIIPLTHLGARWVTRKIGFKSQGVVDTVNGPSEIFTSIRISDGRN